MSERARSFRIVPVNSLPTEALVTFASDLWGPDRRDAFVDSWWISSKLETAKAAVVGDDGDVAGVCVGVPSQWDVPAGTVDARSICVWYVSPRFAGLGVGKALVNDFGPEAYKNTLSISEAAVQNFRKLGWIGPFASSLLLLPLPQLARSKPRPGRERELRVQRFVATVDSMPGDLSEALDIIDAGRPAGVLRRRRREQDWRFHIACRPERRFLFAVVYARGQPVGYFASRSNDEQSGRRYRLARLHFVTDFVVNSADEEVLAFLFSELAADGAANKAGALLLCCTSPTIVAAARASGWLSKSTPLIGRALASKAPLYMLGDGFKDLASDNSQFELTFADSDVDFNI